MDQETIQNALQKLQSGSPRQQLIAQIIAQQQIPEASNESKVQVQKLLKFNQELKKKLGALQQEYDQLLEYLEFFIQVNNEMAQAVGACQCWGMDEHCDCQQIANKNGIPHGKPGSFPINKELWRVYVVPALSQIKSLKQQ